MMVTRSLRGVEDDLRSPNLRASSTKDHVTTWNGSMPTKYLVSVTVDHQISHSRPPPKLRKWSELHEIFGVKGGKCVMQLFSLSSPYIFTIK